MKIIKVLLKIIGIAILISLIIIGGYLARNYIIINKLAKVYDDFFSSSNYSYTETLTRNIYGDSTNDVFLKYYYKEGKKICYSENKTTKLSSINLYDESLQELTTVSLELLKGWISNDVIDEDATEYIGSWLTDSDRLKSVVRFEITTEEMDGVECYAFRDWTEDCASFYFNKETGKIFEYVVGCGDVYRFDNWKQGKTSEEDVTIDMEKYNIFDNRRETRISK